VKKILHIVGTRPNYVKAAPVIAQIKHSNKYKQVCVNTGQHRDDIMSTSIMDSLDMDPPDISFSLKEKDDVFLRFGEIASKLAFVVEQAAPDLVIVYGDVDSALAGAVVSSRLGVKLAHVESGLRSFDRSMPEENNRILIDQLATVHFVTELAGLSNLVQEGHKESIDFVGNTMIDSLKKLQSSMKLRDKIKKQILLTCHRPSNVDNIHFFEELYTVCKALPFSILWPIHPRTKNNLNSFNLLQLFESLDNMNIVSPMNYSNFLKTMSNSAVVITDSGGVQEETTFLNVPCLTIRDNTERPITVDKGSNTITLLSSIKKWIELIENGSYKNSQNILKWDGNAAERIFLKVDKLLYDNLY